jgi:dihydroorotate dehydrogenase electron transfer subunit
VRALGPNGNGYDLAAAGERVILIGGGLGIPPLLFAARRLRERGNAKVVAVLGYRKERYCADEMRNFCEEVYVVSEEAHPPANRDARGFGREAVRRGNAMDLLETIAASGELDISGATVLSCGPKPMLRAVARWAEARRIPAQLSLEERMGCGYGACVGCACSVRVREDDARSDSGAGSEFAVLRRKVCADGPVFWSDEIIWEEDLR